MKVPFADLGLAHKEIRTDLVKAINKVIVRGDFILGEEVRLLEKEFARFCETRYAVGVSSGTAALFLALVSLGIKRGDEVIVPDFTYIATAMAVSYAGARPVFVDIEEDTYNIDTSQIKRVITKKTKAIIPVHLYGQPAAMPEMLKIAKEHHLKVIEDAAQAHGATFRAPDGKWVKAGAASDIACFSFYPSKNLGGMGDGGMIVTDKADIYRKLLILRDCGRTSRYEHPVIGYNSRLDTLQAAILRVKLRSLNKWNEARRRSALLYNKYFKDVLGVVTPVASKNNKHIYHVYAIRVKNRDRVFQVLKKKGIGVIIHYPIPCHLQKAYKDLGYKRGDFPISEKVAQEIMSLPMFAHLEEKQIKFIVDIVREALKE
ncbi:MAG: DegT/DnrJ/EryC1/StrS family aminotransferase [Candidatus Omnitrophota bacterium]